MIAGNFDKDEVLKTIEDFYGDVSFSEYHTELIPYTEKDEVKKKKDEFTFPTPMAFTEISFKISKKNYTNTELLDLDFYLNAFYTSSFGITSTLYKQLVDDKTIIDSIRFNISMMSDYIIFSIGAYTEHPKKFQDAVLKEIKELKHLDQEKFEMDKKNAIVQIILRDENIFQMIFPFINNIVFYHYPYLDQVDDVEKLTYASYVEAIHNLSFQHYSILTIHPLKK